MNWGSFFLLTITFTVMLLLIQRTEPKRRFVVAIVMLLVGILVQRYVNYREFHSEAQAGFVIALVLNGLFWLFIGRYNPVGSSDDIQVIGMDD